MGKKVVWFVGCFLFLMNGVYGITLSCPEVVSPGEVFACQVKEEEYVGLQAKYEVDSGFVYQSCQSNWKRYYSGVEGFSVGNVLNRDTLTMNFGYQVGMDVLVNQDYTIGLIGIEGSTLDYQYRSLENVYSKVRVVSDVNTLDSLKISNGKLNPSFRKDVMSYQVEVKGDTIVIEGIASDRDARIEGDIGKKKLSYGVNNFTIRVISARGNVREYHLYVTRVFSEKENSSLSKSSDVSLKSLVINKKKIALSGGKFLYSYSVENDVLDVEVEAIATSKKATVEVQKPKELVVGENVVRIIVTAEDGTVGTYMVVVDKKHKLSGDTGIKKLVIKGYDLDFVSDVYQYTLEIEDEEKLDIQVVLNDKKAKYQIKGNKKLKNNSVIKIEVTAENGSQKVYEIKVMKLNEANSSSIASMVKIIPLVGFILLLCGGLVIKVLRKKMSKKVS